MSSAFDTIISIPKTISGDEPSEILSPGLLFLSGHPARYSSAKAKRAAQHVSKYMKSTHDIELIIDCCKKSPGGPSGQHQRVFFTIETLANGDKKMIDSVEEFVALMKQHQQQKQQKPQDDESLLFFHMSLVLEDEEGADIAQYFDIVNTVLKAALDQGIQQQLESRLKTNNDNDNDDNKGDKNENHINNNNIATPTLVHCQAGQSRSATLMAAFLMNYFRIKDSVKVIDFMHSRRRDVSPNPWFLKTLEEYGNKL